MAVIECAENCGQADAPSELYVVTSELFGPGSHDYTTGVTYEFKRKESDRCVWERRTPGQFPWQIERLSRYPNGWEFFEVQPVPGKWTWRLSIDAPQFFLLHGWLKQLDRHDEAFPDPSNSCSSPHDLETYVPLSFDGPVTITPVSEPIETPQPGQSPAPCFCQSQCPPNTKPHRKYFVKTVGKQVIPFHDAGFLYEIRDDVGSFCDWKPVDMVADFDGTLSKLDSGAVLPATDAYQWDLQLINHVEGTDIIYILDLQWSFLNGPLLPAQARCDVARSIPSSPQVVGDFATIRPVPEWMCTSDQAAAWDEKYPIGIPTPTLLK